MGYKCCMPFCKGNCRTGPKVSVFSFPRNPDIKRKWMKVIQRADFDPSTSSYGLPYYNNLNFLKNVLF